MKHQALIVVSLILLGMGCGESATKRTHSIDASYLAVRPLGWLGARVQPLLRELAFDDAGTERVPGGVVVRELNADGALARAGARIGDVLVRVGDAWLPLVENARLPLMSRVEQAVSGGGDVVLTAWRDGALVRLTVERPSHVLEAGLPYGVKRFAEGTERALNRLRQLPPIASNADLTIVDASWTGLALIAAGATKPEASSQLKERLAAATKTVRDVLESDALPGSMALAWALIFEASLVGPLPDPVLVALRAEAPAMSAGVPSGALSGLPGGAIPGNAQVIQVGSPDEMKKLLESLGASGGSISISGELPPGTDVGELLSGAGVEKTPGPKKTPKSAKPAPKMAELLAKHDPDRVKSLKRLRRLAEDLYLGQNQDGGWASSARDDDETFALTCQALIASGSLRRVGIFLPEKPIGRGIRYIADSLAGGNVSKLIAKGADRRLMAGKAALACLALRSVGVAEEDPVLAPLLKVVDDLGPEIADGTSRASLSVLAVALLDRGRGIGAWQRFYDGFRTVLVANQEPDGSFVGVGAEDSATTDVCHGTRTATAWGALILALQGGLPVVTCEAENPAAKPFDGKGEVVGAAEGEGVPTGMPGMSEIPKGATIITDPSEIKKLLEGGGR